MNKIDKLLQEAISEAKMLRQSKEFFDKDLIENALFEDDTLNDLDFSEEEMNYDDEYEDIVFNFDDETLTSGDEWDETEEDFDLDNLSSGEDLDFDNLPTDEYLDREESKDIDEILEALEYADEDDIVIEIVDDDIDIEEAFDLYDEQIKEEDEYEAKKSSIDEIKRELKNSIKVINNLKENLEEVNISRAKLYYMNKLLMEGNYSSEEKRKLWENFNKAESVKEASLLYEALKETHKKKPIREGFASKMTKSTRPQSDDMTAIDTNYNEAIRRMMELAGININKY